MLPSDGTWQEEEPMPVTFDEVTRRSPAQRVT